MPIPTGDLTSVPIKILILEASAVLAEALAVALELEPDFSLASGPGDATVVVTVSPPRSGMPAGVPVVELPAYGGLDDVIDAIRAAAGMPATADPAPEPSPREMEVLLLLSKGMDPATVAKHLNISTHTARQHVKNLRRKLSATSTVQALAEARRRGMLRGDALRRS